MKKFFLALAATFLLTTLLAGCGDTKQQAKPDAKSSATSGVIKVGTEPTFAPFEFADKEGKNFDGFDMDLIRALGKQLNKKIEIVNMGFDALIPALNSGNIDVAIAGMSITPERQKAVDFSDPYYVSGLTILVNQNNNSVKSINDLKDKKIAVQIGTTGADKAAKVPGAKVVSFNTNSEVFMELKNNGVDAVIIDKPVAAYYLTKEKNSGAKMVGEAMDAESYGMALKKGNKRTAKLNKALDALHKSGEYDQIYKKWFGELPKK
jgi:glutamine transport system substrate-binding protein